jgi:hypothetical protein
MIKNLLFFFVLLCCPQLLAEELTFPTGYQDVSKTASGDLDLELSSLQWNRYVNEKFVILSIDDKQGVWLNKNIKQISSWCLNRWGFDYISFSKECRIFCVPNKELLKKLFGLDESRVEVRKKDGSIEISVIWVSLDGNPFSCISSLLTRASFSEFEEQNFRLPWWFIRSSEILNSSLAVIKADLLSATVQENSLFNCKKLFETSFEDYNKMDGLQKLEFDKQSLYLCLMLRKELGEVKLLTLLKILEKNKLDSSLNFVYGYSGTKEFEDKYSLYYKDLSNAIKAEKVPDSYFEILSTQRK